ncbi:MAG: EamA family transporter [Acidobacteriaceae bacterium]
MRVRKLLAYAAIYFLWSGSFLAIRILVAGSHPIPPFFAAAFRFTLAGLILLIWSRLTGPIHIDRRQLLSAAALGLIMFTFDYAGLFWAETRVASGLAAVVLALIPVWVCAGEIFVLRTLRATALSLGGIALGFGGVIVLSLRSSSNSAPTSALAMAAMIAATLSWSFGTLWSRRLTLPRPHQANAGLQMLFGGLYLFILSASAGEFRHLPPAAILLSPRVLVSMAYLIVAASILAYTAYVWLIAHDSPTRVSSYAYVNPVFALILGATLAGERLTSLQIAGAALVLVGVVATLMGKQAPVRDKKLVSS